MGTTDPFREKLRGVAEQIGAITEYAAGPLAAFIAANRLTVYGHSYTPVPSKYVPAGAEWPSLIASDLGLSVVSHGRGGSRMIDAAHRAIGTGGYAAGQPGVIAIQCEMNDTLDGPSTTSGRAGFEHALRAFLAAVTAGQRVEAETAATTGSWVTATGSTFSGGAIRRTNTAGATLTFDNISSPTGKVYILTVANRAASATGAIKVAVNGTDQGINYVGSGQMEQFNSYVTSAAVYDSPAVIPVTIPTTGRHAITVRQTGDAANIYVDALLIPAAVPPPVLVVKDPPVGHLASQARQDAWAANAPALHRITERVASEFPTARIVDLAPGWEPEGMVAESDTSRFHPGEAGMEHIAGLLKKPLVDALMERLAAKMWD